MQEFGSVKEREEGLEAYLSPAGAWSLSVGTAIGWGSFLFTTTLYLQKAGPAGSAIGMLIGMIVMLIICRNYHFLMNAFPTAGGVYTYVKEVLGFDKAFLSFWFVTLAYLAMLWANATSVPLFINAFFGSALQFGYLYTIFGYKIYAGEVLITMALIVFTGLLCMKREKLAVRLMVVFVLLFTVSITVCMAVAFLNRDPAVFNMKPAFIPGENILPQIVAVSLMTPWAFIGFENISHSTREFSFDRKHSFKILAASVVTTTLLYIFVLLISISAVPPQFANWLEYLKYLGSHGSGVSVLPPFQAAQHYLGGFGFAMMAASLFSLIMTSLIGNFVALSRLLYQVAQDDVIPDRFAVLNRRRNPARAVFLVMILSVGVPLLGRTAIGWIVDVLIISAVVVYILVSSAAFKLASKQGRELEKATGFFGMFLMAGLAATQIFLECTGHDTLEPETYFLVAVWAVFGFLFLRNVLHRDYARNFGRSVGAWIVLMGLIAFVALSWMRHVNQSYSDRLMDEIASYYRGGASAEDYKLSGEAYLKKLREAGESERIRNNALVLAMILISLGMFFSNYSIVRRREQEIETELHATRTAAYRDPMTGVKSKQAYADKLAELEERARNGELRDFAFLVADVNGLKYINDTFGHKAGDAYICDASALICRHFKHCPVYRIGGDEFVALMEGDGFASRHADLAAFNRDVESNMKLDRMVVVSAGISEYRPGKDKNVHEAFERADEAMYERKKLLKSQGARTRD